MQSNLVNPLESSAGTTDGFISARLMAAYKLDSEHVVHIARDRMDENRIVWSYVLERNDVVIFEGADFSTGTVETYGDAARELLGFLTLSDGDTDAEYFESYTADQLAWRDECAMHLSIFGMEDDD